MVLPMIVMISLTISGDVYTPCYKPMIPIQGSPWIEVKAAYIAIQTVYIFKVPS